MGVAFTVPQLTRALHSQSVCQLKVVPATASHQGVRRRPVPYWSCWLGMPLPTGNMFDYVHAATGWWPGRLAGGTTAGKSGVQAGTCAAVAGVVLPSWQIWFN